MAAHQSDQALVVLVCCLGVAHAFNFPQTITQIGRLHRNPIVSGRKMTAVLQAVTEDSPVTLDSLVSPPPAVWRPPWRPPPGQERSPDYDANVGKVIDTLQSDYPAIFDEEPDFGIYTEDILVTDPTGVSLCGKRVYRQLFGLARFLRKNVMKDVSVQYRIVHSPAEQTVRVRWHTQFWLPGSRMQCQYVDGVSVYFLNQEGWVYKHKVEKIIVNGLSVEPPYALRWNIVGMLGEFTGEGAPALVPMPQAARQSKSSDLIAQ